MEEDEIAEVIATAIARFYAQDHDLVIRNAGERALTDRIARYIEDQVQGYAVTVEYDRHGVDPKAIDLPDRDGVLTRRRVVPDIIVHQVGHDHDNLLVIEAKKSTNPEADEHDLAKLQAIKDQMGYRFAVFLRLSVGVAADPAQCRILWV